MTHMTISEPSSGNTGGGAKTWSEGVPLFQNASMTVLIAFSHHASHPLLPPSTVRYSIASFILRHNAVRLAKHKKNISIASLRATAPFSNKLLFKKSIRIVSGGDWKAVSKGLTTFLQFYPRC
jgi:hypothetical protein